MLNVEKTIIAQFANSPSMTALIGSFNDAVDARPDFQNFYDFVWNIATAQGFGLDIWGRIVGLPNGRYLQLGADNQTLGFENADVPPDWAPFNQGTFYTGANSSTTFRLADDPFRTLILAKALANITGTTSQALNQLLRNLFPGRGRAYVIDRGKSNTAFNGMQMSFVFEFALTAVEYAILTQSGVLPHPAGVGFNVIVIQPGQFNFREEGLQATPFGSGTFYLPPH